VGLYLGNDVYDAYGLAYDSESYSAIRDSERASALVPDTVRPKAISFRDEHLEFQRRYGILTGFGLSYWSRAHLALGRALNNLLLAQGVSDVDFEADKEWAAAFPEQGTVYTTAGTKTVFLTAYRLMALDLNEPRIAEGLRITKALLPRMRAAADANGAKLLVLIIPTKESVYAETLSEKVKLSARFAKIVDMEAKIRAELISTCHEQAIESVDALPDLSDAIRRGDPIYPSTADDHLKARGYQILAARVNDALAKLHW